MAGKMSVTVPLTAQQKEKIRRATGKSISALKVEGTGGVTLKKHLVAARKGGIVQARRIVQTRRMVSTKRLGPIQSAKFVGAKFIS